MKKLLVLVMTTLALVAGGCKQQSKLIDHVTFKPSDNLEVVRVSLVFTKEIKSDLAGIFALKNYGSLFINPFTDSEPFEVGFDLNTSIVNDQDYIKLTPTSVLPNGVPIGLEYALVEIRSPNPISSKFDLYGYVDVLHANWMGISAMFGFLNDQYFPPGLSINQVFLNDDQGRPGILASVFGPTLNSNGTLARAGGISLFANVRQLIQHHVLKAGEPVTFYPVGLPVARGEGAEQWNGQFRKMRKLESKLLRGFNQLN